MRTGSSFKEKIKRIDRKIIFLILVSKIFVFLIIFIAYNFVPFDRFQYRANLRWPPNEAISLLTAYKTWDAQNYLFLSEVWYQKSLLAGSFYPLFPLLIVIIRIVTQNSFVAGMLVSNIASIIALYYFYLFVKQYFKNDTTAKKTLLLLLLFPTSFYLSLIYSESIFLALAISFFYYLYQDKYQIAASIAFFLPLSRPVGIFIIIPWVIYYLFSLKKNRERKSLRLLLSKASHPDEKLIFFFMPLFGYLLYFGIMLIATGDAFSGIKAAGTAVGKYSPWNVIRPDIFIQALFSPQLALHGFTNSLTDRLFFVFFLLCIPLVYKKTDLVLLSFYLILGMVPVFGTFMSYTRYLLPAFPLYMALAALFSEKKLRLAIIPYAIISFCILFIFVCMQATNHWVS